MLVHCILCNFFVHIWLVFLLCEEELHEHGYSIFISSGFEAPLLRFDNPLPIILSISVPSKRPKYYALSFVFMHGLVSNKRKVNLCLHNSTQKWMSWMYSVHVVGFSNNFPFLPLIYKSKARYFLRMWYKSGTGFMCLISLPKNGLYGFEGIF